jgi:hypothetical protein
MTANPSSPRRRGLALLATHCASAGPDPDAPSARERLEKALGAELAQKLVVALSAGAPGGARFAA